MDTRLLYTNISNNKGIKAVETTLKRKNLPTKIIISFLKLILTLNNFIFNCANFLQIKECAMGTKCAPTYANIFMGIFEERHIYLLIKQKVQLYLRYIHNIFSYGQVLKTNYNNLHKKSTRYISPLNLISTTRKPKYIYSTSPKTQIHFLDITKTSTEKLLTTLYKKEINVSIENQCTLKLLNESSPICKH